MPVFRFKREVINSVWRTRNFCGVSEANMDVACCCQSPRRIVAVAVSDIRLGRNMRTLFGQKTSSCREYAASAGGCAGDDDLLTVIFDD